MFILFISMRKKVIVLFFDFLPLEEQTEIMQRCKSYLNYIGKRNPEFLKFVSTEELTSVFLNEVDLSDWILARKSDLEFIAHLNEFIHFNKEEFHLFTCEVDPLFKPQPLMDDGITDPQKSYLKSLLQELKLQLPTNLEQMKKKDATQLIAKLKAEKERRYKK